MEIKNEKIQELHSEEVKSENLSENSCQDSEEKSVQPSWRTRFVKVDEESVGRFSANKFINDNSLFLLFNVYLLDSDHPVPLVFGTYLHFDNLNKGISYLESISLLIRENLAVNHSYAISLAGVLEFLDNSWYMVPDFLTEPFYQAPLVFEVLGTEEHKLIRLVKWLDSINKLQEFLINEI